jgi:hypothetical protein
MNGRIRELINQVGTDVSGKWMGVNNSEKLAELILIECMDLCVSFGEEGDGYTIASEISEHFGVED